MQGSQGDPGTVGARPLRLCFTAVSHSRYHLPFHLLPVGRLVWGKTGLGVLEVWIKGLALTLRVGHVLYLILLHLLHPRPNACLLQMHDVACGVHKRAVVLFLGCMQCMSNLTSFMVVESSVFHMPGAWPSHFSGSSSMCLFVGAPRCCHFGSKHKLVNKALLLGRLRCPWRAPRLGTLGSAKAMLLIRLPKAILPLACGMMLRRMSPRTLRSAGSKLGNASSSFCCSCTLQASLAQSPCALLVGLPIRLAQLPRWVSMHSGQMLPVATTNGTWIW